VAVLVQAAQDVGGGLRVVLDHQHPHVAAFPRSSP